VILVGILESVAVVGVGWIVRLVGRMGCWLVVLDRIERLIRT
jgi:hypothetical protein